jgi:alginate O-acetyltransferase complex protein AlgI
VWGAVIFTSVTFLVFFTAVLLLCAVIRGTTGRMWLLLVASYLFYANWNPYYVLLIFMYGLWGWGLGLAMYYAPTTVLKRTYFWLTVVLSLGTLCYFKYANFFLDNAALVFGTHRDTTIDVVLPVGISFFAFHTMSYNIDLYRGTIAPCRSPTKFFLFVSFFPQLVAGPILRASNFLPQLDRPIRFTWANAVQGTQLFIGGAIQKTLFADYLSIFVDQVYRAPEVYSASTLWLAVAAYSVQIFCDFAGYSLMAIGVAKILGFDLPENFRMPYLSQSVGEFWRRWHISLSSWLRDYLYIPLGGNRRGVTRTQVNMAITMLLGGLWHGASWNFVLWGGLHGVALGVHRAWTAWRESRGKTAEQVGCFYRMASWLLTLLFCCLAWIPFRSPSWSTTVTFFQGLIGGTSGTITWHHVPTVVILVLVAIWHAAYQFAPKLLARVPFSPLEIQRLPAMLVLGTAALLLVLMVPLTASPFIYFQF